MAKPNMSRNQALAGQSVQQGSYVVTYDSDGYATSAKKGTGGSAVSTPTTTTTQDTNRISQDIKTSSGSSGGTSKGISGSSTSTTGSVIKNSGSSTSTTGSVKSTSGSSGGGSGGAGKTGSYVASDPSGVDNYHAKNTANDGKGMSASDQATLESFGTAWNDADAKQKAALAEGNTELANYYQGLKDQAHQNAEALRGKYGYSGGTDGSEYIEKPVQQQAQAPQISAQAPDFTELLDSWLETAKKQQELGIDYATKQGVEELERAKEDAEEQFQVQQDQVSRDEAKALDNQALYAEARGDRGGIGQAQYGQIQATAMTNRRAVNSARTKLATDTARQIADLRAQGEFEKADALLQLTQTYLGQLIDLQKWGAEYALDVQQFNAQLKQWQAEFDLAAKQWQLEFDYTTSKDERDFLAESGLVLLKSGIRPSKQQQAAMGYTDEQIDTAIAAYKLAQAAGVKYTGNPGGGDDTTGMDWSDVEAWVDRYGEDTAEDYIKEHYKELGYTSMSAALSGWKNHLLSRDDEEDEEIASKVENPAAHDWILVPGYGRLTWQELEAYVNAGKIIERYNEKTGKYTYTMNRSK